MSEESKAELIEKIKKQLEELLLTDHISESEKLAVIEEANEILEK